MSTLYAWATPAFVSGSPVDHTWITSYDSRNKPIPNINQVISSNEDFWFSKGSFHPTGKFIGRVNYSSPFANCLVESNTDKGHGCGTVFIYGLDGVCHQVSNQVLYRSKIASHNLRVDKARGYKLSSVLYGTYGRRMKRWNKYKQTCNVVSIDQKSAPFSLLLSRAHYASFNTLLRNNIKFLEAQRVELLHNLDEIGFASRKVKETISERVVQLNARINNYLYEASSLLQEEELLFIQIFGVKPYTEINIIDPELFDFPDSRNDK